MFAGTDFRDANLEEEEPFAFNFVRDLAAGEQLSTTTWTISLIAGKDPDPNSHLIGQPRVQGTMSVQKIGGLMPGCRYLLVATVVTDKDNSKVMYSHVAC